VEVYKWIWKYVGKYKHVSMAGLFLVLSASMLGMVNPYMAGIIVDRVISGRNTDILLTIIGIILGVTLLRTIMRYVFQLIFETVSQNVVYNIRDDIYSRLQELDFKFFDTTRTGDIMSRMTGDIEAVRHFVAGAVYNLFESTVLFIFVTVVLFIINFEFALIMLAISPLIAFLTFKLANTIKPVFTAIREQFSRLNTVVQENISGNRVVKAFAMEGYEVEKFARENSGFREKNLEAAAIWGKYFPMLECLAGMLSVVMVLIGGVMVINGLLTLGELVIFNGFIWAISTPIRMSGWLINDVQRFSASADKIMKLLSTEPEIKKPVCPVAKNRIKGSIEFENVSFGYGDGAVLKNISFKVEPGQTVAFVGPTGSGKSTVVNLICRFYDCTEGEILVDGININKMDMRKLRADIAVAIQDVFLFSDTIEGNIAYGVPDATISQVRRAASVANADGFISGFREGYDTIVGERGVGLSGGQKQRVALSRALLKNPSVFVFDDTTSSVDMETEHKIQMSLKQYFKEKTTVIIAHRISSVKDADMIFVLDGGNIIERGRHEELIRNKGYYYSMYTNQSGDFDNICAVDDGQEVL